MSFVFLPSFNIPVLVNSILKAVAEKLGRTGTLYADLAVYVRWLSGSFAGRFEASSLSLELKLRQATDANQA